MKIETRAYARAGLLGNPSDGYFGKIIAIALRNFSACVRLRESRDLCIRPAPADLVGYRSLSDLAERIELYGYYGGLRLIRAALKCFHDHCREQGLPLPERNFTLDYDSDIPRQIGMGGSSAIITAVMRALMSFYEIEIPIRVLPTIILRAEREELGINAGFMDRVIQVYEGCVYMDLSRDLIESRGYGEYERLDVSRLPDLYLAYRRDLGKVSGRVLNSIRLGYQRRDPLVLETLARIAEIAETGRRDLAANDLSRFPALMDENFDLRGRIMTISPGNLDLVRKARGCGASAKFAGSGGTIIGTYEGEDMFRRLEEALTPLGAVLLRPDIG